MAELLEKLEELEETEEMEALMLVDKVVNLDPPALVVVYSDHPVVLTLHFEYSMWLSLSCLLLDCRDIPI